MAIKVLHLETIKDEIENIQKEISLQAKLDPQHVRPLLFYYSIDIAYLVFECL